MRLLKSHGLGNDYLVLHQEPHQAPPSAALIQALCDRHRGPGSDGLLVPAPAQGCDYGLRIFNPDGSEAEKSGNGIRIFARYLVDHRGAPADFSLHTLGGVVGCQVGQRQITVDMGRARFLPDRDLELDGRPVKFTGVDVGNPHCVIFVEQPFSALPWRRWGAFLETHPLFPNRSNVQFVRQVDEQHFELRIWERGAGETEASGSSSCAVAAAAAFTGRAALGAVRLSMPGGELKVTVGQDWALRLEGPVEEVGWFAVSAGWLAARA